SAASYRSNGYHLPLLAVTKRGSGNLCRMVTAGRFRGLREGVGASAASYRSNERPAGIGVPALQNGQRPAGGNGGAGGNAPEAHKAPAEQDTVLDPPAAGTQVENLRYQDLDLRKEPRCPLSVVERCAEGVVALSGCRHGEVAAAVRRGDMRAARHAIRRFQHIFGHDRFFIELCREEPGEAERLFRARLSALAEEMGAPVVATANVHYLTPEEAAVQEVLACMQTLTKREEWHAIRRRGAERYLKSPREMMEEFASYPEAIENTVRIAEMCEVDLGLGEMHFPHFRMREYEGEEASAASCRSNEQQRMDWWPREGEEVEGERAERLLEWLCWEGVKRRYGSGFGRKRPAGGRQGAGGKPPEAARAPAEQVEDRLRHELGIIRDLGLCEYFLVVWDIVEEARARGIRCSGRGSAADSLVSYVLGITQVDPIKARLLFERFLNPERRGMPDIDIDFDSRKRDEMIEYVARRYGPEHTGMVATINTFNARSAIREVGKALGLSERLLDRISKSMPYIPASRIRNAIATLPELRGCGFDADALKELLDICEAIDGFPRHLSVHLGGVVISRDPITDFTPLEVSAKGVIVCQFDKDDVEALGLVKMDLLGLRNLAAIEEALHIIRETRGESLDLGRIPLDDEKTYELMRSARTVGVFQLESPGMRGLLSGLQPTHFGDIIANISLFRPGPMQADMIGPFLARRHGREEVTYLHPSVRPALEETYGVILYQEQVLEVASALAGFTLGQSDSLRRAMTHDRSVEEMEKIGDAFLEGCKRRGVTRGVAEEAFRQLSAFAAYGFCRAHAASFAIIAYETAYLKAHYPAEFLAGILSNQPMGFYPAEVIVNEAKHFGIEVRPVNINRSRDRYWVEEGAIRVGLAQVYGLSGAGLRAIRDAREGGGPFTSLREFCARTGLARPMVENLIKAGAFDGMGARRELLWELNEITNTGARRRDRSQRAGGQLALLEAGREASPAAALPAPSERERAASELAMMGLSVKRHPLSFARERLDEMGVLSQAQLESLPDGRWVRVAGIVIARQRPPTKSGQTVVFITLEDEAGLIEVTVFERIYKKWGKVIFSNGALIVDGVLQKKGRYGTVVVGRSFRGLNP
ncbi:MAG TPA: DNA polymerase III subunit alpha, partial [Armatimonadota bacterium]|nr:DNA polymerase III subunit alpha [Armatimonadota bacterium]